MHLGSTASHHTDETWSTSDLVPAWWPIARTGIMVCALSRDRCLELLDTEITGRLFLLQRPTYPLDIHYRVSRDALMIDPAPSFPDPLAGRPPLVMVCVDRLHPDEMHGWSLVVVGSLVTNADDGAEPALLDLRSLTGRTFAASHARPLEISLGG